VADLPRHGDASVQDDGGPAAERGAAGNAAAGACSFAVGQELRLPAHHRRATAHRDTRETLAALPAALSERRAVAQLQRHPPFARRSLRARVRTRRQRSSRRLGTRHLVGGRLLLYAGTTLPGSAIQRRSPGATAQRRGGFAGGGSVRRDTLWGGRRRVRRRQKGVLHHGDQRRNAIGETVRGTIHADRIGRGFRYGGDGAGTVQHGGVEQALRPAHVREDTERQGGGLPTESRLQPVPPRARETPRHRVAVSAVRLREDVDALVAHIHHVVGTQHRVVEGREERRCRLHDAQPHSR